MGMILDLIGFTERKTLLVTQDVSCFAEFVND